MDDAQRNIETAKLNLERTKLRLDYLTRQYGFYTSHLNQVFNFYLVASALIASAFVQSLAGANPLDAWGSRAIAAAGIVLSLLFLLLHLRGFQIAGILDDEIKPIERGLGLAFMRRRKQTQSLIELWHVLFPRKRSEAQECSEPPPRHEPNPFARNTTLYAAVYVFFCFAFTVAVCNVNTWRREENRGVQVSVSQTLNRMPGAEENAPTTPMPTPPAAPASTTPAPPAPRPAP